MRALPLVVLAGPLVACSATIRRPVWTTDAAAALEQVTRSGQNEFDPAVSPDGSAIAYDVAAGRIYLSESSSNRLHVVTVVDPASGKT